MSYEKQVHDITIVFEGDFSLLHSTLEYCLSEYYKIEFIPPGLDGSKGILQIKNKELP